MYIFRHGEFIVTKLIYFHALSPFYHTIYIKNESLYKMRVCYPLLFCIRQRGRSLEEFAPSPLEANSLASCSEKSPILLFIPSYLRGFQIIKSSYLPAAALFVCVRVCLCTHASNIFSHDRYHAYCLGHVAEHYLIFYTPPPHISHTTGFP